MKEKDRSLDSPDRQIMNQLMESIDKKDLGICPNCNQEGIILTAVNCDEVKGCWVCIKNNLVVNPTGKGFCPPNLGEYYK